MPFLFLGCGFMLQDFSSNTLSRPPISSFIIPLAHHALCWEWDLGTELD